MKKLTKKLLWMMKGKLLPLFRTTLRRADTIVVAEGEAASAAAIATACDAVPTLSLTSTCRHWLPQIAALTLGHRVSLLLLHKTPLQGLRC